MTSQLYTHGQQTCYQLRSGLHHGQCYACTYRSIRCTSQNTETVIQMFQQPTAAFISEYLTLTGMHVKKIQKGSQTMMWSREVTREF